MRFKRGLVACGLASACLYTVLNAILPFRFVGYRIASQTVSELSAIGAPTRGLWIALIIPYQILLLAFGGGVFLAAGQSRALKTAGVLLGVQAIAGFFWPPMHLRGADFTLTDALHIAFTFLVVPLMVLQIFFSAAAFGRAFRVYAGLTVAVLLGFGILTGLGGPNIAANLPTPCIGIWERISIGAYIVWTAVLSIALLRQASESEPNAA